MFVHSFNELMSHENLFENYIMHQGVVKKFCPIVLILIDDITIDDQTWDIHGVDE